VSTVHICFIMCFITWLYSSCCLDAVSCPSCPRSWVELPVDLWPLWVACHFRRVLQYVRCKISGRE
jgi:hypothetical protein